MHDIVERSALKHCDYQYNMYDLYLSVYIIIDRPAWKSQPFMTDTASRLFLKNLHCSIMNSPQIVIPQRVYMLSGVLVYFFFLRSNLVSTRRSLMNPSGSRLIGTSELFSGCLCVNVINPLESRFAILGFKCRNPPER